MPYRSSPDPKRRSFPKKDGGHKSYGSLPNLNNGSKDRVPHPSLPLRPQYLPFSPLTVEDALAALGLGDYLTTPALNLAFICDSKAQTIAMVERTIRAGERFNELRSAEIEPRTIAQRCISLDEIRQMAHEENASGDATGLALLVELCRVSPADLVVGIGKLGQPLIGDLRREAAKMYPDQAGKFVTQAELEQGITDRQLATEPDAFLLAALGLLYGVSL